MNRIDKIKPLDKTAYINAQQQWNNLAKPLGSLGAFEDMISKIAGINSNTRVSVDNAYVVVMCGDNGVIEEDVTQSDYTVTTIVARNIMLGKGNISRMANANGIKTIAIDIGMKEDTPKGVINKKIANGTSNFLKSYAMTVEQVKEAICVGIDAIAKLKESGADIIVAGEMGIGNTVTSSALASILLNTPAKEVTGRGAGLDDYRLNRKIEVVQSAYDKYNHLADNPIELLAAIGGYDIAGMVGLFLGGAYYQVPIVIDGVISTVSAVIATKISHHAADYMLPSHVSEEVAAKKLLDMIGFFAPINANLRLGEGTGGVLLIPLLKSVLAVYNGSTFSDFEMESYTKW